MKRGPTFHNYHRMNPSEQRFFDRWLVANAAIASIFAGGIFALAIMGGIGRPNLAQTKPIESTLAVGLPERATPSLPIELILPVVDRR